MKSLFRFKQSPLLPVVFLIVCLVSLTGCGESNSQGSGAVVGTHTSPTHSPIIEKTPTTAPSPTGSVSPACSGETSHTAHFTFSIAVKGPMKIRSFEACGPITEGKEAGEYVGVAQGTIGSKSYSFSFAAGSYAGPGTYMNTVVSLSQNNPPVIWAGGSSASDTVTINSDGQSGSLQATLLQEVPQNTANLVQVIGSWSS